MSEYASTLGTPIAFPSRPVSAPPARTATEESTVSGYSTSDCDYDDDIYSTDLSSFAGGGGGEGGVDRSTLTDTSNYSDVVNLAAQTIALRQQEQLAQQQQINGTSAIIP